jgi:hypothetical protein
MDEGWGTVYQRKRLTFHYIFAGKPLCGKILREVPVDLVPDDGRHEEGDCEVCYQLVQKRYDGLSLDELLELIEDGGTPANLMSALRKRINEHWADLCDGGGSRDGCGGR